LRATYHLFDARSLNQPKGPKSKSGKRMTDIDMIRRKAAELGFSLSKGLTRFSGYRLIRNEDGEVLVGPEAPLKKVEEFVDNALADVGIDFEAGAHVPSKPPLTNIEIKKSLQAHAEKDRVKRVLEPPPSTQEEQRRRIATDRLVATGINPRSRWALERASQADRDAYSERLRTALAEEEKIKAAELPADPQMALRDSIARENARRNNAFRKADEQLKTNLGSLRDYDSPEYRDHAYEYGDETPEEILREERERYVNHLPPEGGPDYTAPTPGNTNVKVASKYPRRAPKAEREIRDLIWKIKHAISRQDFVAAGSLFKQVKDRRLVGHGDFEAWVEKEFGIRSRTAQRYIKAAKAA
jgi:hypothetical protein